MSSKLCSATALNVLYGGLIVVVIFLYTRELDAQPLQFWDEARLAINALNIDINHDYLVMYYGRFPDTLNTKPPVVPILQNLSYKLFDVSVWSHRLPAALAALLTSVSLVLFSWKFNKIAWPGLVSALILASMPGFNGVHVARTGDYDALLVLFTTLYCLMWYTYLLYDNKKYLAYSVVLLSIALLIKCSAALLPLPGLIFYTLYKDQDFVRIRNVWWVFVVAFIPLGLFYFIRELSYPGYLRFTLYYDWIGAAVKPLTGKTAWYYYFPVLWQGLGYWKIMLATCLILIILARCKVPHLTLFCIFQICVLLIIGVITQTRMPWYIAHAFPMFALLIGSAAIEVYDKYKQWILRFFGLIVCLLAVNDTISIQRAVASVPLASYQQYGDALIKLNNSKIIFDSTIIMYEKYNPLLDYHLMTKSDTVNKKFIYRRVDNDPEAVVSGFKTGQQVFGCLPKYREAIEQRFIVNQLASIDSCWCLRLSEIR